MKRILLSCLTIFLLIFLTANPFQNGSVLAGNSKKAMNGCQTDLLERIYKGSPISAWIDHCSSTAIQRGDFVRCAARLIQKLERADIIGKWEKQLLRKCTLKKPTMVLYNGSIYTMEKRPYTAEAVFIKGDRIQAVGTNAKILAKAKKNTVRINLHGRAVFPGFIDPHTHLFNEYSSQNLSLDEVQQLAVEAGITTVGNMYNDPVSTDDIMQYAWAGNMRLRLYLYLNYNHSCGDVFGTWYEAYAPRVQHAPKVWVNGVKIMAERSVCQGMGVRPVFSSEMWQHFTEAGIARYTGWDLHLSLNELTAVIQRANDYGYQVAIHAIGDLGIETSLSAITLANNNAANPYRHMVLHNYFIRDDMLDRYSQEKIVALVEPTSPCHANSYVNRVGELNRILFKRWRDLVNTGAHVGLNSDWPFFGVNGVDPMRKLYAVVTGKNGFEVYESDEPCEPPVEDQTVSILQGLKMMTIESAYALHTENQIGSIKAGKKADLVVLSDDPFEVEIDNLMAIRPLMTIIDGKIEFKATATIESLRPSSSYR